MRRAAGRRHAEDRPARRGAGGRGPRLRRQAGVPGGDRRPGTPPRPRPDAQGGPRHRHARRRRRRGHHRAGDAQHRAARRHPGAVGTKKPDRRTQVRRELGVLPRGHAGQPRRTRRRRPRPHAGDQDLHRVQHRRFAGGRPGRAGTHLRGDRRAAVRPLRGRNDRRGQPREGPPAAGRTAVAGADAFGDPRRGGRRRVRAAGGRPGDAARPPVSTCCTSPPRANWAC